MNRGGSVVAVCVWYQYDGVDQWVISHEGEEGEEVTCTGGDEDDDEAWRQACEEAEALGVPARQIRESGETIREWTPEVSS